MHNHLLTSKTSPPCPDFTSPCLDFTLSLLTHVPLDEPFCYTHQTWKRDCVCPLSIWSTEAEPCIIISPHELLSHHMNYYLTTWIIISPIKFNIYSYKYVLVLEHTRTNKLLVFHISYISGCLTLYKVGCNPKFEVNSFQFLKVATTETTTLH